MFWRKRSSRKLLGIKSVENGYILREDDSEIYFFKVQSVWIIIAALVTGSLLTLYRQKRLAAREVSDEAAASKEEE